MATSNLSAYGPFGESLIAGTAGSGVLSNSSNDPMGWAANPIRTISTLDIRVPTIYHKGIAYSYRAITNQGNKYPCQIHPIFKNS